jgi:hypothetical protein
MHLPLGSYVDMNSDIACLVCIVLMQHVMITCLQRINSHAFAWHLQVPVLFVHVATYYLVYFVLMLRVAPLPDWLTDCLVDRTSPTSPCPLFGWLPYWISTRFKRWWEWKHMHTPLVSVGLHTIRGDPSIKFVPICLCFLPLLILVFGSACHL